MLPLFIYAILGNGPGEVGALRLLADLYGERGDHISALRCLERVVQIDKTYRLPQYEEDNRRYEIVRQG